jgi:hypothetical protein
MRYTLRQMAMEVVNAPDDQVLHRLNTQWCSKLITDSCNT